MRLIAIPLARARPGAQPVSTFLAQKTAPPPPPPPSTSSSKATSDAPSSSSSADAKPPLLTRVMDRASQFWVSLGTAPTSTLDWKRRTYNAGETLMDRIEYEEWALKGVDPTLAPPNLTVQALRRRGGEGGTAHGDTEHPSASTTGGSGLADTQSHVPLLYPRNLLDPRLLVSNLRRLTSQRTPHHRTRMLWCMVGMPITLPFALVPVVPNLPFFYLAWRAWSHWKALQSSRYLSALIDSGRLVATPSDELEHVLTRSARDVDEELRLRRRRQEEEEEEEEGKRRTDGGEAVGGAAPGSPPPPPPSPPLAATTATTTTPTPPSGATEKVGADGRVADEATMLLEPHHVELLTIRLSLAPQSRVDLVRAIKQTRDSIRAGELEKLERAALGDGGGGRAGEGGRGEEKE